VNTDCAAIDSVLRTIWGPDMHPVQSLTFMYGQKQEGYRNSIELQFKRQITEEQMEDIPELLQHILQSAEAMEAI
jgi:hypothetical protein